MHKLRLFSRGIMSQVSERLHLLQVYTNLRWNEQHQCMLVCKGEDTWKKYAVLVPDRTLTLVFEAQVITDPADYLPRLKGKHGYDLERMEHACRARIRSGTETEDASYWHFLLEAGLGLLQCGEAVRARIQHVRLEEKPALHGHAKAICALYIDMNVRNQPPHCVQLIMRRLIETALQLDECMEAVAALRQCELKLAPETRWLEKHGLTYGSVFGLRDDCIKRDTRQGHAFVRFTSADVEIHLDEGAGAAGSIVKPGSLVYQDQPVAHKFSILSFDIETCNPKDGTVVPMWTQPCAYIYAIAAYLITPSPDQEKAEEACTVLYTRSKPGAALEQNAAIEAAVQARVGSKFELYSTEKTLLNAFFSLIRRFSPDIVCTYNGNGYDWPFILHRCKALNLVSRLSLHMHAYTQVSAKGFDSAAAGQRDSWELSSHFDRAEGRGSFKSQRGVKGIPGILNIDMLPAIRKDHKFSSYKLGEVAPALLQGKGDQVQKVKLSYAEQRRLHLTEQASAHGEKALVQPSKRAKESEHAVEPLAEAIAMIVEYVAQDAYLVPRLMEVTLTPSKTVALASLTSTDLQGVLDRGQQIKIYNTLMRTAHNQGRVGNNNLRWKDRVPDFPGAVVLPPVRGFHGPCEAGRLGELASLSPALMERIKDLPTFSVVQVWDFMSLYPSIIITFLLCYSTFMPESEAYKLFLAMRKVDSDEPQEGEEVEGQTYKDHLACFAKDPNCVLSALEKSLFEKRKEYKKLMKKAYKEGDMPLNQAYNAAQLAVKVVMNSAYGFTGVPKHDMYAEPMIAATTTACGRAIIAMTKTWAQSRWEFETVYTDTNSNGDAVETPLSVLVTPDASEWATLGPLPAAESGFDAVLLVHVVYGDTDSVMPKLVRFHKQLSNAAWEAVGTYCSDRITERFTELFRSMGYPEPMIVLEYEKLYHGFLLISKKRYAGDKVEPGKPAKITVSGLDPIRRDKPKLLRDTYTHLLEIFIRRNDSVAAMAYLNDVLLSVLENRRPIEDYVYTTQVKRAYANPDILGHQLKLRGKEQGSPIESGERVSFYYGKPRTPKLAAGLKAEMYFHNSPRPGQSPPCRYHLIKFLRKPLTEMLSHFTHMEGVEMQKVNDMFKSYMERTMVCASNRSIDSFFKPKKR